MRKRDNSNNLQKRSDPNDHNRNSELRNSEIPTDDAPPIPENVTSTEASPDTASEITAMSNATVHSQKPLTSLSRRDLGFPSSVHLHCKATEGSDLHAQVKIICRMLITLSPTIFVSVFVQVQCLRYLMIDINRQPSLS